MKRICVLLILLTGLLLFTLAPAEPEYRGMAEISVPQFAAGPVTLNLMIIDMPAEADPEIRFYPFDAETGLYASGSGEPAGDRAGVKRQVEPDYIFTVSLNEPGKYTVSGIPIYVLPADNEPLAALADEIRTAADKAEGKTQKVTAQKLYEWLLKRVKSILPEDQPELLEACTDPFNCLLTGYALPETYGELYRLLLRSAKIRSIPVTGTAGETAHSWVMCRLDDQWVYADPAMDDVKDKAGKKYFAPEEKQFFKDHVLSEASSWFLEKRLNASVLDLCENDEREMQEQLIFSSEKEGPLLWLYMTEGKRYSLGTSEPVTIHCYSSYAKWTWDPVSWQTPEEIVAGAIVPSYIPWDSDHQRFIRYDGTSERMPEGAIEVLDYAPDYSRITIRFLKPGMYQLNGSSEAFYILDPANEDHVKVAELLDEALASCRRDTEKETAKALHDWEKKRLKYDRNALRNIWKDFYDEALITAQDPVNALMYGKSVCGGFSNLYQLLLESAGIRCFAISGSTSATAVLTHAWNLHRLDGEWSYTDVTWDNSRGSSAYFAQPDEKFRKDHVPLYAGADFMECWVLRKVYDDLLFRFYRDWGPKDTVPEALKILPASAKDCGFPSAYPDFYENLPLSFDGEAYTLKRTSRRIMDSQCLIMDAHGYPTGGIGYNGVFQYDSYWIPVTNTSKIFRLTVQNYREGALPTDKASIRQILEMPVGGEIEYSEYNYQVPMKKNEIKGYGTDSYRTFTYDMNRKKTASSWHLVGETETLDVTVYFDSEGKTVRYMVSRAPAGGSAVTWEATAGGDITRLSYEYGENQTCTLADMTDRYSQKRYAYFLKLLRKRYESFFADGAFPEEGVHFYALSRTNDELYSGYIVTATKDPLFFWNEQGGLEFNPDARDLNGEPVNYLEFDPDLSVCERLQIAGNNP